MRLLLVAIAACSAGPQRPTPPTPTPHVSWQVTVRVPPELPFNMETVDDALAGPGERPEVYFREGLHASTRASQVTLSFGRVPTSTAIVDRDNRGEWKLTRANGHEIRVALDIIPADAEWFDVDGKLVAVSNKNSFAQINDDGTVVWSARISAVGDSVQFLGTTHGRTLFQLRTASRSSVIAVDFMRRTATVALQGQAGRGVIADRANQLAILALDRLEVFDLATGNRLRDVALPASIERTTYGEGGDLGFDGAVIWSYVYAPASNGTIVVSDERCAYDVIDATSGRLLRTLANATGEWKRLSERCAVRAMLARSDGVIVVRVDGQSSATIVKFDWAP